MAGRLRYFKEQNGNFYTRIAIPKDLQAIMGKTQCQEALGSNRKSAERLHHGFVTKFQAEIANGRRKAAQAGLATATRCQFPLTTDQIALSHYRRCTALDERMRNIPGFALVVSGVPITP